jgi:hypothetical protein
MTDIEWHSKDGKVVRKNPRRVVKKCNRPFTAPRRVVEEIVDSEVQLLRQRRLDEQEYLQRTERRVNELWNRIQTSEEIFDDSEEENRVSARKARFNRN